MKKLLVAMVAMMIWAGCSSPAPKPVEKPQPKPAEVVTGRTAFQKLYVAAHGSGARRAALPARFPDFV